jgi:hypothetical protein
VLWAVVAADGTVERSFGVTGVVKSGTGFYDVGLDIDFEPSQYCAFVVGLGSVATADDGQIATRSAPGSGVYVQTYDSAEQPPIKGFTSPFSAEGLALPPPDAQRERCGVGYRPSRVRRRMPRRFWTARSSSPSFFAAQMNAQTTTATVNTLTAAITIPRKVLTTAA